jgi:hypothetical protein
MKTLIATLALIAATTNASHAQNLKLKIAPPDHCLYVGALKVVTYNPRVVQPRYYEVTPITYADMKQVTRTSVMHPRYDDTYRGSDVDTNRIKFAMTIALPCSSFESKAEAKKALKFKIKTWWNIITSMPPYKSMACCWGAKLHKAH